MITIFFCVINARRNGNIDNTMSVYLMERTFCIYIYFLGLLIALSLAFVSNFENLFCAKHIGSICLKSNSSYISEIAPSIKMTINGFYAFRILIFVRGSLEYNRSRHYNYLLKRENDYCYS